MLLASVGIPLKPFIELTNLLPKSERFVLFPLSLDPSVKVSFILYEVELPGYSTDGTPKVNLYNSQYYAVGERPSDLSMNQGKVITTPDFTQPYTPNNPYQYEAMSNDLSGLDSLTNTSSTLQKLER